MNSKIHWLVVAIMMMKKLKKIYDSPLSDRIDSAIYHTLSDLENDVDNIIQNTEQNEARVYTL